MQKEQTHSLFSRIFTTYHLVHSPSFHSALSLFNPIDIIVHLFVSYLHINRNPRPSLGYTWANFTMAILSPPSATTLIKRIASPQLDTLRNLGLIYIREERRLGRDTLPGCGLLYEAVQRGDFIAHGVLSRGHIDGTDGLPLDMETAVRHLHCRT